MAYQPVTGFYFDWAGIPPVNFSVVFHNSSDVTSTAGNGAVVTATSQIDIPISIPYNESSVNEITPYMSNTTNITLPSPIYSGKYATLVIQGNQADNRSNATGATVAEWAIIAGGS